MIDAIIVGLGNPGREYARTRHNVGQEVVDLLVERLGEKMKVGRDKAAVCETRLGTKRVVLAFPTTYMNLSGRAVKYWMDKEKVAIENTLTVFDDLALPLNQLRLRPGGSDAGHNGLKSIQESLGTSNYPKLRFGIGNNYPKGRQVDFVLGRWTGDEEPLVKAKIEKAVGVIEQFVTIGIAAAMNAINKVEITL